MGRGGLIIQGIYPQGNKSEMCFTPFLPRVSLEMKISVGQSGDLFIKAPLTVFFFFFFFFFWVMFYVNCFQPEFCIRVSFLKSLTKEACFLLDSLLIEVIKNNFSVISLTFYVNCKAAVSIIVFWTISGLGAQLTNLGLPCFSQGQQLYPCNSFF